MPAVITIREFDSLAFGKMVWDITEVFPRWQGPSLLVLGHLDNSGNLARVNFWEPVFSATRNGKVVGYRRQYVEFDQVQWNKMRRMTEERIEASTREHYSQPHSAHI